MAYRNREGGLMQRKRGYKGLKKAFRALFGRRSALRPSFPKAVEPPTGSPSATGRHLTGVEPGPIFHDERQLQALLARTPPAEPRPNGKPTAVELGDVALALECGMIIPEAGVAVRGWISDPHDRVTSTWLEIGGVFRQVEFARQYRQDIVDYKGLDLVRPGYNAGFTTAEAWSVTPAEAAPIFLHCVLHSRDGPSVLSSGVTVSSAEVLSLDRLWHEFKADSLLPHVLERVAHPFLRNLAEEAERKGWHESPVKVVGTGRPDLSIIIAVHRNPEMISHILGFLEMTGEAGRTELIVVLRKPELEERLSRLLRLWRGSTPFASVRMLVSRKAVTFGVAIRGGLQAAQCEPVVVMSDHVVPPTERWVADVLDELSARPNCLLMPSMLTFDGRISSSQAVLSDFRMEDYEPDHSETVADIESRVCGEAVPRIGGVVFATRSSLAEIGAFDISYTLEGFCFLDLLARYESVGEASVSSSPSFVSLPLAEYDPGTPLERLWNLYTLAGRLRELTDRDAARFRPSVPSLEDVPAADPAAVS